ncbi:MAG: ribulose-phosphate 3-epimerase, partial [Candidatus Omnitrophica bacterium]|nr:ribulose-phosphate 3-epimerase [Candidatus Omnitrophota bacterium]
MKIGASILAADFSNLLKEMRRVEKAGVDFFHVDIMDGHFVPNITIGPGIVANIRKSTKLPLDIHLMIERPFRFVERFQKAGADAITVHVEAVEVSTMRPQLSRLKSKGIKVGLSLNPATPLVRIKPFLDLVDFVLIMTVNPGFGGQRFINSVLPKMRLLRKVYAGDIAVDGGITEATAKLAIKAGANILDAGTY